MDLTLAFKCNTQEGSVPTVATNLGEEIVCQCKYNHLKMGIE
jgi:hypothetical protein